MSEESERMNLKPISHLVVHQETHHITNCMHSHSAEKNGGMSFKSQMQQNIKEQPQTLEGTLNELAAINQQINDKHKMFGTGNTLGNIVSDVNGEGEEAVVVLMPEQTTEDVISHSKHEQVSADMLNAIIAPRNSSLRLNSYESKKNNIVEGTLEFDSSSGKHKNKRQNRFTKAAFRIKTKIKKWLYLLPEKIPGNTNEQSNRKEMRVLSQDYILDSYNKKGQYHQIEKQGIIDDSLNKKA